MMWQQLRRKVSKEREKKKRGSDLEGSATVWTGLAWSAPEQAVDFLLAWRGHYKSWMISNVRFLLAGGWLLISSCIKDTSLLQTVSFAPPQSSQRPSAAGHVTAVHGNMQTDIMELAWLKAKIPSLKRLLLFKVKKIIDLSFCIW